MGSGGDPEVELWVGGCSRDVGWLYGVTAPDGRPTASKPPPPTTAVPPPVGIRTPGGTFGGRFWCHPHPPPFPKGVTPKALWGSNGWQQRGAFIAHGDNVSDSSGGGGRGSKAWGGADPITPPSALPIDKGGGMSLRRSPRLGGGALGDCRTKKPQKVWGGGGQVPNPPPQK